MATRPQSTSCRGLVVVDMADVSAMPRRSRSGRPGGSDEGTADAGTHGDGQDGGRLARRSVASPTVGARR